MPARRTLRRLGILLTGCLPALIDPAAIARAGGLEALATGKHPYFVAAHFGLLYLWAPLVALRACLFFMLPGLLLAWAIGAAADLGRWILYGLALSLVVVSAAAAVVQSVSGHGLTGTPFAIVVLVCAFLSAAVESLPVKLWREAGREQPGDSDHSQHDPARAALIETAWLQRSARLASDQNSSG